MSTNGDKVDDRKLWAQAGSLLELGGLMARWLTGEIHYQPGYDGGPDEETGELVEVLARVNRAGFITDFSQPGELMDGWQQRASVTGFCDEATVDRMRAVCAPTDVIALWFPPGSVDGAQIVVSLNDAAENTWVGAPADPEDLRHLYGEDLSPAGVDALLSAWQLQLVDPVWGRENLLWQLLVEGLSK